MNTMIAGRAHSHRLSPPCRISLAAVFALAACLNDATDPGHGAGAAAGTYALISLNGQSLPATYQLSTGVTVEVKSGMFTLNSENNRYAFSSHWEETDGGQTTSHSENCTGTWRRNGNSFFITETRTVNCGGTYTATWDGGDRLTVSFAGSLVLGFAR